MFDFVQNNKIAIQVILGAVALTFVGFGVGSYSSAVEDPYLAKVGSAKIYKRDLDRVLEGQPSDAATRQQAMDDLIRQNLLLAAAHDGGAVVTPEQLRKVIAGIAELQENGQFSASRYKEFLAARNMSAEAFEAKISRDIMLQNQINNFAGTGFVSRSMVERLGSLMAEERQVRQVLLKPADFAAQVKTDDKALQSFYDANAKRFRSAEAVKLDYVLLSPQAVAAGLTVSDAEVKQYYEQNKADLSGEERRASHILLTVAKDAKPADKVKVKAEAEALLKQLRADPGKFAELAKSRSQDPGSAANGGDLGFFAHGVMVKPFDDVVFRMQPGKISEVVETEFGYHIIKLDEIKQPDFAAVRSAVEAKLKQQKAAGQLRSMSDKLAEVAYQQADSLKGVQDALKLEIKHSDWLSRDKKSADPALANAKVLDAAFSDDVLKKKHNSEPVDIGGGNLVVVRVADHQPARQQALAEVREQIKAELIATEGAKLAEKQGQALLAQLKAGKAVEAPKWGELQPVSRRNPGAMPTADVRAVFSVAASPLPAFAGSKHDNGDYAIYQIASVAAGAAVSDAERTQLAAAMEQMTARNQLGSYLETLRQKYPIKLGKQQLNDQSEQ
ncbi:SurA N-terminal domain-containing protein [Aquitalea aquatica]|uniref:Periplasmic chaperone PpiD n=1 Tax=Aquitalea aquatica TaxID=3044273 RepID=A0A838YFZ2_9NEIS|nr:SurA N-terminal domain-containing protein [Aquitalea magnusonii]MBA4709521.1 SurA N-terminal domain-containing protein [Aquitalea magnusonii]